MLCPHLDNYCPKTLQQLYTSLLWLFNKPLYSVPSSSEYGTNMILLLEMGCDYAKGLSLSFPLCNMNSFWRYVPAELVNNTQNKR